MIGTCKDPAENFTRQAANWSKVTEMYMSGTEMRFPLRT